MKVFRSFKYRIYPNRQQKDAINKTIENCAFLKRRYLEDKEKGLTHYRVKEDLAIYKERYQFLKESDTSALMNVLFKANDKYEAGSIQGSTRIRRSYTTSCYSREANCFRIVNDKTIYLPKVGYVSFVYHRPLPENCMLKSATVINDKDAGFYVSIMFETDIENFRKSLDKENSIGLDYSVKHFLVDSEGQKYDSISYYRNKKSQIRLLRKKASHSVSGSKRQEKILSKVTSIYRKTARQRRDHLHKLTTQFANTYDYVFIEDLSLRDIMARHGNLIDKTRENAFGEFCKLLEYKMKDRGKELIRVDKWFPSTKMCSECGYVAPSMDLEVRTWKCPNCGQVHDRDINSAINIKNQGKTSLIERR